MASGKISAPRKATTINSYSKSVYPVFYNTAILMYNDYSATFVIRGLVSIPNGQNTALVTIPEAARPKQMVYSDFINANGIRWRFSINNSTGELSVYNYGESTLTDANLIYTLSWTI